MRVQITDQHFYKFIVVCSDGGGDSDGGDGNGGDGDGADGESPLVMMMVMMEMVLVQMVMVMVQMVICVCSDGGGDAFQLCESQECGLLADPEAPRVIGPCWRDSCPPLMMMTMLI